MSSSLCGSSAKYRRKQHLMVISFHLSEGTDGPFSGANNAPGGTGARKNPK